LTNLVGILGIGLRYQSTLRVKQKSCAVINLSRSLIVKTPIHNVYAASRLVVNDIAPIPTAALQIDRIISAAL
jgi:hypothetical protein